MDDVACHALQHVTLHTLQRPAFIKGFEKRLLSTQNYNLPWTYSEGEGVCTYVSAVFALHPNTSTLSHTQAEQARTWHSKQNRAGRKKAKQASSEQVMQRRTKLVGQGRARQGRHEEQERQVDKSRTASILQIQAATQSCKFELHNKAGRPGQL